MMLFAAVFSVATVVCGCGWTISASSVRMDVYFWNFSINPSYSTSVADSMAFFMILHSTCTGPFSGGIDVIGLLLLDCGLRGEYPPDMLCAYGSEM